MILIWTDHLVYQWGDPFYGLDIKELCFRDPGFS